MSRHSNTFGIDITREEAVQREEASGMLRFHCCSNDGNERHTMWLAQLKDAYSRQAPCATRGHAVDHLMESRYKSMIIINCGQLLGGVTFRVSSKQLLSEVIFGVVLEEHRQKGYGSRLMNHLKKHVRDTYGSQFLLAYTNSGAFGYFLKQGFKTDVTVVERERKEEWMGSFPGCILMEFQVDPHIPYTDLPGVISRLNNVDEVERDVPTSTSKSRYDFIPPEYLKNLMVDVLCDLYAHDDSWPFHEPVDLDNAPEYLSVVEVPMDLGTISIRLYSERSYPTIEMFTDDVDMIFANAKVFYSRDSVQYRCAERLEEHFVKLIASELAELRILFAKDMSSSDSDVDISSSSDGDGSDCGDRKIGECSRKWGEEN